MGLRNHLTSFPSESSDEVISGKNVVVQRVRKKEKSIWWTRCPNKTRTQRWRRPGILPPRCFFSGLTTRPHFLSRRGEELKSKVYHWFMLPANVAYCAMLWPNSLRLGNRCGEWAAWGTEGWGRRGEGRQPEKELPLLLNFRQEWKLV